MPLFRNLTALLIVMLSAIAVSTTAHARRTYNTAPTIAGTPSTAATIGVNYAFQPTAADANGDTLRFSIKNKPRWASFNSKTGLLSGVPQIAATYKYITISVSDGKTWRSLAPFSISVIAARSSSSSSSSSSSAASSSSSSSTSSLSSSSSSSSSSVINTVPTITGTPSRSATVGTAYSFKPTASDANGDALGFSIVNKPVWASFNTSTGLLSGTPGSSSIGSFSGITISVSDGKASASLAPFTIAVVAPLGSASLTWTAPAANTDGSPLTDLSGYKIYYGATAGNLSSSIAVDSTLTSYVINNLSSGTWYFAISAVNSSGVESSLSSVASKTI